MVGLSVPSSIAEEEETLINSNFLYNLLFFKYTLVSISGFSFIYKIYHNFSNIKSANYPGSGNKEDGKKGGQATFFRYRRWIHTG